MERKIHFFFLSFFFVLYVDRSYLSVLGIIKVPTDEVIVFGLFANCNIPLWLAGIPPFSLVLVQYSLVQWATELSAMSADHPFSISPFLLHAHNNYNYNVGMLARG